MDAVYIHSKATYHILIAITFSNTTWIQHKLIIRFLLAFLNTKSIDIKIRVISSQIENAGASFYIEKDNNSCER